MGVQQGGEKLSGFDAHFDLLCSECVKDAEGTATTRFPIHQLKLKKKKWT